MMVVLGVSGGPDSTALLHILREYCRQSGRQVVAVYVDHGLRPDESAREEELVRKVSTSLSLHFEVRRVAVQDHAREFGLSLEHAARELRYRALEDVAGGFSRAVVAVAHTADDQAEEILLRLIRGSGLKGISGMLGRNGNLIRPLLKVSKEDVLNYLEERGIAYCIDSSNQDMRFLRNRIRHQLLPFLEEKFDSGIRTSLCKTADVTAQDEELLDGLAEEALAQVIRKPDGEDEKDPGTLLLDRKAIQALPPSLQRRVTEKVLWQLGCRASYPHILQVVEAALHGRTGAELHLSRGLRVGVQKKHLAFLYPRGKIAWRGKLYKKK